MLLFLNTTAGIAIISQAAPMAEGVTGATAAQAAGMVGIIAIANGAGRLFWAWLSDAVGRRSVFLLMFPLQALVFALLPSIESFALFTALLCAVLLCYGGGFGTLPAFAADYFGSEHVGPIYGLILTAWSVAGVLGPTLIATLRRNYRPLRRGSLSDSGPDAGEHSDSSGHRSTQALLVAGPRTGYLQTKFAASSMLPLPL